MEELNSMMRYQEPKSFTLSEIEEFSDNKNIEKLCEALIGIGLFSDDCDEYRNILFNCIFSENKSVASAAIVAINHLARRYKNIDLDELVKKLNAIPLKDELHGVVQETIDDISFLYGLKK